MEIEAGCRVTELAERSRVLNVWHSVALDNLIEQVLRKRFIEFDYDLAGILR